MLDFDNGKGKVLRIEHVKPSRDDATLTCVADNGVGEPAKATATLQVYPSEEGMF